ncbi:hypothetical protein Tco_0611960, partial [Tanacetum coccineum]
MMSPGGSIMASREEISIFLAKKIFDSRV